MHPEAAACGAVVRAASHIVSELNAILKPHNLSEPSFNVLRILRGGPEEGLTCGEVGNRLLSRGPDVTRLVDRLEREGLVQRRRHEGDKRVVVVTLCRRATTFSGASTTRSTNCSPDSGTASRRRNATPWSPR